MSPAPQPSSEGSPTRRPRRAPPPLRAHAVLGAHADLVENCEQFPVSEADQGDLATLLLVLVDIQHAALELSRAAGESVRTELAAVKGEMAGLSRRAARAEDLLKELVRQAKAGNATANEQVDLLDELAESLTRVGEEQGERAVEGDEPEEVEDDEPEGDGLVEEGDEFDEDEDEDSLAEAMRDREEEEDELADEEARDGGVEPTAEVVAPDAILPAPAAEAAPRPRFAHPEVK